MTTFPGSVVVVPTTFDGETLVGPSKFTFDRRPLAVDLSAWLAIGARQIHHVELALSAGLGQEAFGYLLGPDGVSRVGFQLDLLAGVGGQTENVVFQIVFADQRTLTVVVAVPIRQLPDVAPVVLDDTNVLKIGGTVVIVGTEPVDVGVVNPDYSRTAAAGPAT